MPTYSVPLIHGTRNAVGKWLVTVGSLTLCRFLVLDLFLFTFRVFCVSIIFQPTTIPTLSPRPSSRVLHPGQILGSFLQLLRRQAPTTSDPAPSKAPTATPPLPPNLTFRLQSLLYLRVIYTATIPFIQSSRYPIQHPSHLAGSVIHTQRLVTEAIRCQTANKQSWSKGLFPIYMRP